METFTSLVEVDRVSLGCASRQGCKVGVGRQLGAEHTASDGPQTAGSGKRENSKRRCSDAVEVIVTTFLHH